jgi:hypothetical protein
MQIRPDLLHCRGIRLRIQGCSQIVEEVWIWAEQVI